MPDSQQLIPFTQGLTKSGGGSLNTSLDNDILLYNCYPFLEQGGRSEGQLVPIKGNVKVRQANPIFGTGSRGLWVSSTGPFSQGFNSCAYGVWGSNLFRVNNDTTLTSVGGNINNRVGNVSFAENQDQTLTNTFGYICDGDRVYKWNLKDEAPSLSEIDQLPIVNGSQTEVAVPAYITYYNYRIILTCANSNQWYYTDQNSSNFENDYFYSSESSPDQTVRVIEHCNNLFVLSKYSYEIFTATNVADDPFGTTPGSNGKIGCVCGDSVAKCGDYMLWLGQGVTANNRVYLADASGNVVNVTPRGVENYLSDWKYKTASKGFAWSENGLTFYALTSKQDDQTLVYCVETKLWHLRGTSSDGRRHFWEPASAISFNGKTYYATNVDNWLLQERDTCVDHENRPVVRLWQSPIYQSTLNCFKLKQMRIDIDVGGCPTPEDMVVQVSWDGGKTWSDRYPIDLGVYGQYTALVSGYAFGSGYNLVARFLSSTQTPVVLYQWRLTIESAGRT